ncbi:unknown [Clostridium sp. CAG:678]|nr:unknown [Clostridium sp. CAG:678]
MFAERKRRKNADLAAGVVPFNIGSGVFFRIAVFLGELERVLKAHIILNHLGKDKIGGAV